MKTKTHNHYRARDLVAVNHASSTVPAHSGPPYYQEAVGRLIHYDDARGAWLVNFSSRGNRNTRTRGLVYVPEAFLEVADNWRGDRRQT